MSPVWPGSASGSPRKSLERVAGEKEVLEHRGKPAATVTGYRINGRKWMAGWMEENSM